ncbi:transcriptional regulator NrpA [Methanosarcina soligelidi]|uniref:transcriptional regulator NrpA n=1 Tax=Methanosarcina soligelidi TaxID=1036677 RepID=UPI000AE76093|nr:transcriptional regulator NrpA [Methanosarcina soligelidi]
MTQHIKIECPSCSPEEKVPHELIKFGISPLVHCLECGLVYIASGLKAPEKISVRVFVNRIEHPFTHWVKLNAGELLREDEEIILDKVKTGEGSPFVITSLQVGVRRVPSALAEELDTIWARPLNEITFAKRRKIRQKHPMSFENITSTAGTSTASEYLEVVDES